MSAGLRLLLVHAHPDDESIYTGATMARYAAVGVQVTLVTCTLGECGEVIGADLGLLAADHADQLGGYRMGELAQACDRLGVSDHRWLGGAGRWRDSGMLGTVENDDPRCFWRAPPESALAALVRVIRAVRPQVLVTYDDRGGYGHPDHIQAHRVTTAAYDAAADPVYGPDLGPVWAPDKLYWSVLPRSVLDAGRRRLRAEGSRFSVGSSEADTGASTDELAFGVPDTDVTTAVDGRVHLAAKIAAMAAHTTQIIVDGDTFALSNGIGAVVEGIEHYRLVRGVRGAVGRDGRETDLFAGVST
ncbi:MAG: N-acetyl-1-D-myo-inositol-2-amino-2-deoxy-alpha-D-glucopyranoside deacetylase [Geodermatophilaceae bacterium]|nr:N-acetyl-1-D-myo-inositol-2-amino-2-deoxy-alpha-D-glucopyranoside deacetylase [Geodermatophilaceae bacterium]